MAGIVPPGMIPIKAKHMIRDCKLWAEKDKISFKFLKLKGLLVSVLIIVSILAIPIVSMPGNKFIKHALEWDYFIGVISFYLLTYFMWKKNTNS